jgi:histidinol-phosphate aminotransferase
MTYEYQRPATPSDGLRLHMNENTGGCSPAVLDVLRRFSCHEAACYPDYSAAIEAVARHLRVGREQLVLTNGLDEAIFATSVAALRGSSEQDPFEAIVVPPAFEMYAACAEAAGGRVVLIPHDDDFAFPLQRVLQGINGRTRIVYLTNPNNPTGIIIPRESIIAIAKEAPHAIVFVDEAYADFSGTSLIGDPALAALGNVLIGRTFSKCYGLAGLRVAALIGPVARIAALRRVLPPYSVNAIAAAALPAALSDSAYLDEYLTQSLASKELLYATLDRLGIRYWRSAANFVLARFGDDTRRIVDGLKGRGIYVRDRSTEHGCAGCVRITTGVLEHTQRCATAIEEILCDAP